MVLHPIDDSNPDTQKCRGEVDEDGTFTLTTFVAGDGAPAGEYAVTITWPLPTPPDAPPGDPPPGDRLKNRYNHPQKSAWKVTIREEDNDLPAFELK